MTGTMVIVFPEILVGDLVVKNEQGRIFVLAKRTNVLYTLIMNITKTQKQILQCLGRFQAREGFPPSVREICSEMGLKSPGSMHKNLRTLEEKRYLEKTPGKNRAWKLTEKAWDFLELPRSRRIPLVGLIAAGTPILAQENVEDELPMDPAIFGARDAFALTVRGDSMKNAQIRDGDLAIIRPQEDAENGAIVAVIVEGIEPEATLKVLRRGKDTVELHAENEDYKPLIFEGEDRAKVKILGKLIGVIRTRP